MRDYLEVVRYPDASGAFQHVWWLCYRVDASGHVVSHQLTTEQCACLQALVSFRRSKMLPQHGPVLEVVSAEEGALYRALALALLSS